LPQQVLRFLTQYLSVNLLGAEDVFGSFMAYCLFSPFLGFFGALHCGKIFDFCSRLKIVSQEQCNTLNNNQTFRFEPSCFLFSIVISNAKQLKVYPVIKETTHYKIQQSPSNSNQLGRNGFSTFGFNAEL